MPDETNLPLRPDDDLKILSAQLTQSLEKLTSMGDGYQGYLAQFVRACFLAVQDGDLESPQASLAMLAPALHLGKRLAGSNEAVEAAVWLRSTARFFEVAKETLAPRLTLDTLLARDRTETEREVLRILLDADKVALRRGEIAARWDAARPQPTDVRIGQILASFHDVGLVVRIKQSARGGSDVAFYRLSRLGRELCERLRLPKLAPERLVKKEDFYDRLWSALFVDTTEPMYLTTFDDPESHASARAFHERVLDKLSEIRRPVHWIFAPSGFFAERIRPRVEERRAQFHLYRHDQLGDRDPTIQVLDGDSFVYPVAPKTALSTRRDLGRETWEKYRITAAVT